MAPSIETERLLLRPFEPADFESYFERILGSAKVMRYLAPGKPMPRGQAFERFQQRFEPSPQMRAIWAIVERSSAELVGHAALHVLESTDLIELAYALGERWWGLGYATEAGRAALQFGFEQLELDPIVAVTRLANVASRRVLEKLGFSYVREDEFYGGPARYFELCRKQFAQMPRPGLEPGPVLPD